MRFEEVFCVEKSKEVRGFMKFATIFFSLMALACLCLPNTPTGNLSQIQTVLLKCFMIILWTGLAVYSFVSAGKQSLQIDFTKGRLRYQYGSPVTQQVHVGTLKDISHLKLVRRQTRNGDSNYFVYVHWRNKKLPRIVLETDSSVDRARRYMQEFAERCHTSCVDLDGSSGIGLTRRSMPPSRPWE